MEEARSQEENIAQDDLEDTDSEPVEQPGDDDGSTDDAFSEIRREDLPPELQAKWDNMNRDYTRKTQRLAEMRREIDDQRDIARIGELVVNHPELSRQVQQVINNQPLEQPQTQPSRQPAQRQQIPDAQEDPEGYLRAIVGEVVREAIGEELQTELQKVDTKLNSVTSYVTDVQRNSEFDNLVRRYPAAEAIGRRALDTVRAKYKNANGMPLSYEEALGIVAAKENADVLNKPRAAPRPGNKPQAPVEKPSPPQEANEAFGGRINNFEKLRAAYKQQEEEGVLGDIKLAAQRAIQSMKRRGEQ